MTVLCIAMGTPLPTVTLYINGFPLRSEVKVKNSIKNFCLGWFDENDTVQKFIQVTRHMVTMVHNVTTDMGHVSCYADNGYGTPMQASRRITISSEMLVILNCSWCWCVKAISKCLSVSTVVSHPWHYLDRDERRLRGREVVHELSLGGGETIPGGIHG